MQASQFANIDWCGNSIRIEYQWVGNADITKPLIVFLHEGLGSIAMWRDFPHQLCIAANCRGLVYSRPGYGKSSPRNSDEHWQVDFMHRQAFEVLPSLFRALNIDTEKQKPWLFGHSDGGSIALLFAAKYVENTSGCIVLAPHIFVEDVTVRSIEKAKLTYERTDLRQKLARFHDDADSAFWGWNDIWLKPEFRFWNLKEAIKTITCPLFAIQGTDDEYGSMEQIHGIKRVVQQTQLLELAACGHSPHKDQSIQVIDAVVSFIALNPQNPNL